MTLDELLSEGAALERPCFLLSEGRGEAPAAFWGGERDDIPNAVPPEAFRLKSRRHIATLDPALFREVGLLQPLPPISLFETLGTDGREHLGIERRPKPQFADILCSGRRLFAARSSSFPPFEAVCLYGSLVVEQWLFSLGLKRHDYMLARGEGVAQQYDQEFMRRAPFYISGADIIVGGWHMMWPDDDFFLPQEMRLVATTLRDAEPFNEVWLSPLGNLSVRARIT